MKLIDVLSIISEYAYVKVYNYNGDLIAFYNGKDNIPEELNNEPVYNISAGADYFSDIPYIEINLAN